MPCRNECKKITGSSLQWNEASKGTRDWLRDIILKCIIVFFVIFIICIIIYSSISHHLYIVQKIKIEIFFLVPAQFSVAWTRICTIIVDGPSFYIVVSKCHENNLTYFRQDQPYAHRRYIPSGHLLKHTVEYGDIHFSDLQKVTISKTDCICVCCCIHTLQSHIYAYVHLNIRTEH